MILWSNIVHTFSPVPFLSNSCLLCAAIVTPCGYKALLQVGHSQDISYIRFLFTHRSSTQQSESLLIKICMQNHKETYSTIYTTVNITPGWIHFPVGSDLNMPIAHGAVWCHGCESCALEKRSVVLLVLWGRFLDKITVNVSFKEYHSVALRL